MLITDIPINSTVKVIFKSKNVGMLVKGKLQKATTVLYSVTGIDGIVSFDIDSIQEITEDKINHITLIYLRLN